MARRFLLLLLLLVSVRLSAQMERMIYQTFEIDSAKTVTLDLVGFTEVEIHTWAGTAVLTEVSLQIWQASPEIVNYFVDQGRYKFGFEKTADKASITTQVRERKVIRTKQSGSKGCPEIAKVKIFVPDFYTWTPVPEGDSDGTIKINTPNLLRWESGYNGNAQDEALEDRNKHKLLKTLLRQD